jgi:hypothetical protein
MLLPLVAVRRRREGIDRGTIGVLSFVKMADQPFAKALLRFLVKRTVSFAVHGCYDLQATWTLVMEEPCRHEAE